MLDTLMFLYLRSFEGSRMECRSCVNSTEEKEEGKVRYAGVATKLSLRLIWPHRFIFFTCSKLVLTFQGHDLVSLVFAFWNENGCESSTQFPPLSSAVYLRSLSCHYSLSLSHHTWMILIFPKLRQVLLQLDVYFQLLMTAISDSGSTRSGMA